MAKIRRIASTTTMAPTKDAPSSKLHVSVDKDVRSSYEGRRSSVITASAPTSSAGATSTGVTGPVANKRTSHVLPPPAVVEEKDDWEEKVKAEMQAATEQIWQVTEAWVDAEAEVEELEWRILEMGIGRFVGLIDAPIDVDETGAGKLAVKSAKKEKLLLDTAFNNVEDTSYWAVRHAERSPEKRIHRYSTPLKTEEFNGSPQAGSGSGNRALQSKLSSPDRKRSLTPTEALRKIEAKLSAAEVNRDKSVHEKVQKAQLVSHRVKQRNEKEAERLMMAGEALHSKLKSATQRHSDYINVIKGRAGSENAKVTEVITVKVMNSEAVAQQLQQKLEEVEAKILAANLRREQRLAGIAGSQRKKNTKKALQMSEFRLQLEKLKMERWEKLQRRIEAVQERRRVRIAELKRRAEDEEQSGDITASGSMQIDSQDPSDLTGSGSHDPQQPSQPMRRSASNLPSAPLSPHREEVLSVQDQETLFAPQIWTELSIALYSDFKSAAALAHKLFQDSLRKPKIQTLRREAWAKALHCLGSTTGYYNIYYLTGLTATNENGNHPLETLIHHLAGRRKAVDDEEREASSFSLYRDLICDVSAKGIFAQEDAVEKLNTLFSSVIGETPPPSAAASVSAASVSNAAVVHSGNTMDICHSHQQQSVQNFVTSGGLLLLTVFLSYEFGLLSETSLDANWIIDGRWFADESKLAGKSSRVELRATMQLLRLAIESVDHSMLLACCALHAVLGELALYVSLIIYKGSCDKISFRATDHLSNQKIQAFLGEVLSLWSLLVEKMILMTQAPVTNALQLFSRIKVTAPRLSLSSSESVGAASSSSPSSTMGEESTNNADHLAALDDVLYSYFQYAFLCQDLVNLFTSIHVAVLSAQVSTEEAFVVWKTREPKRLVPVVHASFLGLLRGAAAYALSITTFIRYDTLSSAL